MATKDNLEEAFAGESQANRKYLAFARRAEREGFVNIARLFRATAEAETIHANSHMRVLGTVKTTEENLTGAMAGEEFEFKNYFKQGSTYYFKKKDLIDLNKELKKRNILITREEVEC